MKTVEDKISSNRVSLPWVVAHIHYLQGSYIWPCCERGPSNLVDPANIKVENYSMNAYRIILLFGRKDCRLKYCH